MVSSIGSISYTTFRMCSEKVDCPVDEAKFLNILVLLLLKISILEQYYKFWNTLFILERPFNDILRRPYARDENAYIGTIIQILDL